MGKHLSDTQIIKALEKTGGGLYAAAKLLKCSPVTIYNRRDSSPAVRAVLERERGILIDEAENAIKRLVKADNVQAATFVLKTVGKGRGWTEHPEALALPFDLPEMVEVMDLLMRSGLTMEEFMARSRMLAEQRLAQMGQGSTSIEAVDDEDN